MRLLRRWDKDCGDDNIITYLHVSYVHFRPTPPTAPYCPLLPPFLFFYFAASLFSVAFNFHPDFYLFLFHFPVCLCSRRRLSVCDQINVRVMLTGKINAWDSLPPAGVRSKVTGHSGVGRGGLYLRHLCVILCVILPFVVFISCNEILFSPILSIFRQKKRAVYQGTAVLAVPDQTEQLRRSIFCWEIHRCPEWVHVCSGARVWVSQ